MTTISHIGASGTRPKVSLTPSGRIKMSFGDTSISVDEHTAAELVQDLEAAHARLAILALRYEMPLAD